MRSASTALRTFLSGQNAGFFADCFTVTLQDGTQFKWTTADQDVNGFTASGPIISRGRVRCASGVEIPTCDITLGVAGWTTPGGKLLTLAAAEGAFDGAKMRIDRLIMPTWGDLSLGSILWFEGTASTGEITSTSVRLTVRAGQEYLATKLPKRVFQPACPYSLYDGACGAVKSPVTATVLSGSTVTALSVNLNRATAWADLGTIAFTFGQNAGLHRAIPAGGSVYVSTTAHTLALAAALPYTPAPGDTVSILIGCDKSLSTCTTKFSNANRYGGFPFVPKPESVR